VDLPTFGRPTIPNFIKESLLLFFRKAFYHAAAQNASHSAPFRRRRRRKNTGLYKSVQMRYTP